MNLVLPLAAIVIGGGGDALSLLVDLVIFLVVLVVIVKLVQML